MLPFMSSLSGNIADLTAAQFQIALRRTADKLRKIDEDIGPEESGEVFEGTIVGTAIEF
jgi:hypothetical protein